jgi:S1-C subfamily serine protease
MVFLRDELSKVVCTIRTPVNENEEIGTAIFVGKEEDAFLITASHVISAINDKTYIILSDATGRPEKIPLMTLLGGSIFEKHEQADIAKAKIIINDKNIKYIEGRCFPYNQINISGELIPKDIELTTIGFPMGLGSTGDKFTPLTFRTFVAASVITLPRFDNSIPCDFIILELPSTGGYSGGPLFDLGYVISGGMTTMKEKTILHGIVHGTISDKTGGKLAAITPCKYLAEWL